MRSKAPLLLMEQMVMLLVFALASVLRLTVFALLALTTVQADKRLADASARAVEDYYAADFQAQELLARVRNGETPEGVELERVDGVTSARYTCSISDTQELQVEARISWDGSYTILRWQAASTQEWVADESLNLWDGP